MDHFLYRNGILHAEDVPVTKIANEVGTPFYVYSKATLERHYNVMANAFKEIPTMICYSVKANSNLAVLKTLADLGSGADAVSEGEIRRARAAGIPPEKIVFSGVGKTREEIRYALGINIHQFNAESREELEMINEIADDLGVKASVAIRVNPDVDAGSHDKISTGRKTDKFGIAWGEVVDCYEFCKSLDYINIRGIDCHIGSQLTNLDPFQKAFNKVVDLVGELRELGHNIETLDLGGGLGIPYQSQENDLPSPEDYAKMIIETIKHLGCNLILEPGRLIAGNSGVLVTSVTRVKKTEEKTFIIVDSAMNDLARPSMYGSEHEIITVKQEESNVIESNIDIVGPICETSDRFIRNISFPTVSQDDLIAIRSVGAYGAVMSSTYNSRPLIPEIMVNKDQYAVIRSRPDYEDMLGMDIIPEWE